jgi:ribokinase
VKKARILVFGSINADEIWDLPRFPHEHEKIDAHAVANTVGGTGANTSSWLAHYGHEVTLLGAVGDDRNGEWILRDLASQGIETKYIQKMRKTATNHAVCMVAGRTKRISRHRSVEFSKISWPHEKISRLISHVDHVHIAAIESEMSQFIATEAKAQGKTLSMEMNGRLMPSQRDFADLLFLNSIEYEQLFHRKLSTLTPKTFTTVLPKFSGTLVVTNGMQSIVAVNSEKRHTLKVTKWSVIKDRTGAGDSFDAGFISSWLATQNIDDALALGSATSSECVKIYGGQAPHHEARPIHLRAPITLRDISERWKLVLGIPAGIALVLSRPILNYLFPGMPVTFQASISTLSDFLALTIGFEYLRRRRERKRSQHIAVIPFRALSHVANDVNRKIVATVTGVNLEALGVLEEDTERWQRIRKRILLRNRTPHTVDYQGWWTQYQKPENMEYQTETLRLFLEDDPVFVDDLFHVVTRLRRDLNNAFGQWAHFTNLSESLFKKLNEYRAIPDSVENLQRPIRSLMHLNKQNRKNRDKAHLEERRTLIDEIISEFWDVAATSYSIARDFGQEAEYQTKQIEGTE